MIMSNIRITVIVSLAAALLSATRNTSQAQDITGRRYGVTSFSVNYMREEPDFAAELGNQALMGTPVEILAEEGYWKKIKSPDPYTAWCVDLGITEMTETELEEYIAAEKIICTADYSRVLSGPSLKSAKICDIVAGDLMLLDRKTPGRFYKVFLPSGERGYVRKKDACIFSIWAGKCDPTADNLIETALGYLGVPYFWGGTSIKGVDCSGLTRMVWFMNGVLLPRNASDQDHVGFPVETGADTATFPVDSLEKFAGSPAFRDEMLKRISQLEKGDLVFFGTPALFRPDGSVIERESITHVGIYLGEGKFIHASKTVRISSLIPGDSDFYELSGKMIKAVRITGGGEAEGVMRIADSPAYFPQD